MTEFDFDELDKAVNNLMSNVDTDKRNTALDDPEDHVVDLGSSPLETSPQPPVAMTPQADIKPDAAEKASVSLATKRRGRFMDIVHPSAAVKPPVRVSRQAPTLQPTTNTEPTLSTPSIETLPVVDTPAPTAHVDTMPTPALAFDMEATGAPQPASTPEVPIFDEQPTQTGAPLKTADNAVPMSDWPDPIDVATEPIVLRDDDAQDDILPNDHSKYDDTASQPPAADADVTLPSQAEQADAPLISPFIADAKVEKRPLGEPLAVTAPEFDASADTVEQPVAEVGAETDVARQESPAVPVPAPQEIQVDSPALATVEAPATLAAATTTIAGSGSIAQQYTEQPSTGDQTNGSIYDTQTYHQPVSTIKPAKKSSLLKWILWIVVLLLIGAAAGAAYFYFTR